MSEMSFVQERIHLYACEGYYERVKSAFNYLLNPNLALSDALAF